MPEAVPFSQSDGTALRESMKELTLELRAQRSDVALTYVRKDTHALDMRLSLESHNKDIALLTTTLLALRESIAKDITSVNKDIGDVTGRVKKIDDDGDWLKKVIYGALIMAFLAAMGIGSAVTTGAIK